MQYWTFAGIELSKIIRPSSDDGLMTVKKVSTNKSLFTALFELSHPDD